MSKTTKDTSVELGGYQELQITYQGHVMRLAWQPADKDDSSHGRYALVMPDDPGY
ncbi:hypothetical protein [Streptomyces sp. 8L]|uniref:hypothetical protein n=1 Tax=Streptomyces sp. 8L TaxID=2877242 RepID=UPI001CD817FA|nr:hypothetical protein [Streptomyces sp. 8L]MCA1218688.1 hypothetical protein [Streptomyces sp. 8L]